MTVTDWAANRLEQGLHPHKPTTIRTPEVFAGSVHLTLQDAVDSSIGPGKEQAKMLTLAVDLFASKITDHLRNL